MRTYNATVKRLRLLADAVEAGEVDPDNLRIQAEGAGEYVIVYEQEDDRYSVQRSGIHRPWLRD